MVSGAVIIGQDLKLHELEYLRERIGLPLFTKCPLIVAYPRCLRQPEKWAYHEGILAYVFGGDDSRRVFIKSLKDTLLLAGEKVETAYSEVVMKKTHSWDSTLHHQQIIWQGEKCRPYLQVLRIFPEEDSNARREYQKIARDLVNRTCEARIKRFRTQQEDILTQTLDRIDNLPYVMFA